MLESIEYFISRLGMYTEMSHSMPAVDEVVVKLIMELVSALALVSRKLRKRRSREPFHPPMCYFAERDAVKWVKNFFGVKDINKARQRLDRLLQEEIRAVGAQTLKAVDGERTPSTCNSPCVDHVSTPRQQSFH